MPSLYNFDNINKYIYRNTLENASVYESTVNIYSFMKISHIRRRYKNSMIRSSYDLIYNTSKVWSIKDAYKTEIWRTITKSGKTRLHCSNDIKPSSCKTIEGNSRNYTGISLLNTL